MVKIQPRQIYPSLSLLDRKWQVYFVFGLIRHTLKSIYFSHGPVFDACHITYIFVVGVTVKLLENFLSF